MGMRVSMIIEARSTKRRHWSALAVTPTIVKQQLLNLHGLFLFIYYMKQRRQRRHSNYTYISIMLSFIVV